MLEPRAQGSIVKVKSLRDLYDSLYLKVWLQVSLLDSMIHPHRRHRAALGLAQMLTAGLIFLFTGVFSIVILAVLGQFATISAIWPAANVTKITTNIANSVVVGAAFLSILVILIMVGFLFVIIGALQAVVGG